MHLSALHLSAGDQIIRLSGGAAADKCHSGLFLVESRVGIDIGISVVDIMMMMMT